MTQAAISSMRAKAALLPLTPNQHEVVRLLVTGLRRPEIARRLGISRSSVDQHLRRARQRLNARDRRDLAIALQSCTVDHGAYGGQRSTYGLAIGDPLIVTGGRFQGFHGKYAGHANGYQLRVRIGGGVFSLSTKFLQRLDGTPVQRAAGVAAQLET